MDFFNYFAVVFEKNNLVYTLPFFCYIFLLFLSFLLLSIFKIGFGTEKKNTYLILSLITVIFAFIIEDMYSVTDFSVTLGLFSLILYLPVYVIRVKEIKVSSEQKKYIKLLDNKIEKEYDAKNGFEKKSEDLEQLSFTDSFTEKEREEPLVIPCVKKEEKVNNDVKNGLNYLHVKRIIAKLKLCALSSFDKKTVEDLEIAIYKMENGKGDIEVNRQIEGGLNALLKIMAKYSV